LLWTNYVVNVKTKV